MKDRTAWTFVVLWFAMAVWSVAQVYRADTELAGVTRVDGLHRAYTAPYEHVLGWVIDPRPDGLIPELHKRYGEGHEALRPSSLDRAGLTSALEGAGYGFEEGPPSSWDGLSPRVRSSGGTVHLLLRKFGIQWVIFYPGLGVVLADALPPAQWELTLIQTREAPW